MNDRAARRLFLIALYLGAGLGLHVWEYGPIHWASPLPWAMALLWPLFVAFWIVAGTVVFVVRVVLLVVLVALGLDVWRRISAARRRNGGRFPSRPGR